MILYLLQPGGATALSYLSPSIHTFHISLRRGGVLIPTDITPSCDILI